MCTGAQTKKVHSKICDFLLHITPTDRDIIDPSRLHENSIVNSPATAAASRASLPRLCDFTLCTNRQAGEEADAKT